MFSIITGSKNAVIMTNRPLQAHIGYTVNMTCCKMKKLTFPTKIQIFLIILKNIFHFSLKYGIINQINVS